MSSDSSAIPRILVVDDEPLVRATVREVLRDEGYEVLDAPSSEECLALLAFRSFDIVLLDLKLPGMDGMQAFKRICNEKYKVDVIMISGHGTIETAVEAVKLGAYDFLEKPFSMAKLKNAVKSALRRRREARHLDSVHGNGACIGKYRIVDKISSGGTATVYRAVQTDLGRTVALKILHSHLTETGEFHERFFREAKITASLSHPNIVQIFDYGREGLHHFLAMELVDGQSLDRHIANRRHPALPAALFIMADICKSLEHAHRRGVIHRDLKPQNILLSREGAVKLADFGLARLLDGSMRDITAPNFIAGTPQFMAPEQVRGETMTAATDIFGIGTLLYLLSTARLPFPGSNIAEVIYRINHCRYEEPIRVDPEIGERLNRVIVTCLQRDPGKRYGSVSDVRKNILVCIAEKDRIGRERLMAAYCSGK